MDNFLREHYQCSVVEANHALGDPDLVAAVQDVMQNEADWQALIESQRRAMEATGATELTAEQVSERCRLAGRGGPRGIATTRSRRRQNISRRFRAPVFAGVTGGVRGASNSRGTSPDALLRPAATCDHLRPLSLPVTPSPEKVDPTKGCEPLRSSAKIGKK